MSRLQRRWNVLADDPRAGELSSRLKVSKIIAQILLNRGLDDVQRCSQFLQPQLKLLHDPHLMHGMTRAAERIGRAIRDHEQIVIYGDYDVDGITATSILWHAIRVLGGSAKTYIPHRIEEGYGLNTDAIEEIIRDGANLIVSVDCGVTAVKCAEIAHERGIDLIITDHHEWHEASTPSPGTPGEGEPVPSEAKGGEGRVTVAANLPPAHTIVHPRLDERYPNPHLCGAGVAFKLAWAIGQAVNGAAKVSDEFRLFLLEATALAALGTIADVVPLIGENRVLAAFGLKALPESKLNGIVALMKSASLTGKDLDAYDVGFKLAPRLNAAGRMGHAENAVEMLTTATAEKALEIATYLEQQNRERQKTEKEILKQAIEQIETNGDDKENCRAIVLAKDGWHPGVIGIVASRIVDRFHRPAIMIALNNGHGSGSARSIPGFHLAKALDRCDDLLDAHGGHEMAAGLKLQTKNFSDFRLRFRAVAEAQLSDDLLLPELKLECETELRAINAPLVQEMERIGPFGHANRRPLLYIKDVELTCDARRVGKDGSTLQLLLRQNGQITKAVAFNRGELCDQLKQGTRVDLAVEPMINEFRGFRTVELEIKDIKFN